MGETSFKDTDVIDRVEHDPDEDVYSLIIEAADWPGTHEAFKSLEKKLNVYLSFALDGQLHEAFPEARDKKLEIEIRFAAPIDENTEAFLVSVAPQLEEHGVELCIEMPGDGDEEPEAVE